MISTGTKRREFISSANIIREGLKADETDLGCLSSSKQLLCDTLIKQLGKPYAYGKDGPDRFDCSGLVEYVYSQIGIVLPRIVADQANAGERIFKNELRFGDILFFSENGISLNHTGIYIGRGYMIHSPKTGDVVKISTIASGYYARVFKEAVRVINNTQPQNLYGTWEYKKEF